MTNVEGFFLGVYDGTGGWQVSEFLQKKYAESLDANLKGAKSEKQIRQAITKTFAQLESEWTDFAKEAYKLGYPKVAIAGSCALIALVVGDTLYVGNVGDSKACLLREDATESS